jgi:hypothetical protein
MRQPKSAIRLRAVHAVDSATVHAVDTSDEDRR